MASLGSSSASSAAPGGAQGAPGLVRRQARGKCAECDVVGYLKRGLCETHYYRAKREGRLPKVKAVGLEESCRSRIDVRGPDECWPWKGMRDACGYGYFIIREDGRQRALMATHLALRFFRGIEVPEGMKACHRCDNPPCCNPAHLFVGTHADNMQDMLAKGRGAAAGTKARGARNGSSKLTESQVAEIRRRRAGGEQRKDLAAEFGVSSGHIYRLVTRAGWRHV